MSVSLYQATIPNFLQILGSVTGLLGKAEEHCASKSVAPDTLIQARLAEDMLPFAFQITSCAAHSQGAIEGLRKGVFTPDRSPPPEDFPALQARIAAAREFLDELSEAELEGFMGQPMRFEFGDFKLDFVAEEFLFTFSQPNFFFHASTAYDILRWKGVDVGKRDFMGAMRLKS